MSKFNPKLVQIGRKSVVIIDVVWDNQTQTATITIEDDNGIRDTCYGLGMSPLEQRQAVADHLIELSQQ